MPSIDENRTVWDREYDWSQGGDEWSQFWGGADMQWYGGLLPRLHAFLPAPVILEIAPGFGRWTQYLKDQCSRLILVDVAEKCILACQERFRGCAHIGYHTNDGSSLACVADGSIDLAFSFDSLVHVETDVLGGYIAQLSRKLTPDGVGFLHHSNLGANERRAARGLSLLRRWRSARDVDDHWRATSVSAASALAQVEAAGLRCISQELITVEVGSERCIDCISVITTPDSRWERDNVVLRNLEFARERDHMAVLAAAYGQGSFRAGMGPQTSNEPPA